uniref:Uncharacterized protein n=1 Tax=Fusarium ananatum TaxID=545334 RepID=A0A6M4B2P9_9HYPO|nr:hypothetical protein [Fusarium ananatum]
MKKYYIILFDQATVFPYLTQGIKKGVFLSNLALATCRYYSSIGKKDTNYDKEISIIYVNFIKALLHNELNLSRDRLKTYREILKFLEGFSKKITFSKSYVSKLKIKGGKFEKVSKSPLSLDFIRYVKKTFPEFNESEFLISVTRAGAKKNTNFFTRKAYATKPSILHMKKDYTLCETAPVATMPKFYKLWGGVLGVVGSLYNKIVLKGRALRSEKLKLRGLLDFALVYLWIFIPYFVLILMSVQANDFDVLDPIMEDDVAKSSYKEGTIFEPSEDFTLKELKGIRSYVDNYDWRSERPNHVDTAKVEEYSALESISTFSCTTDTVQSKARPKNNFHFLFRMLDFNNLNYSPSLFQRYTFPDVASIKYKFTHSLGNFWPCGSNINTISLDTIPTTVNDFFKTYAWNRSSVNLVNIPKGESYPSSEGLEQTKSTVSRFSDKVASPIITIVPNSPVISPNSSPPLSAYFEYNPKNLRPLDTSSRTLDTSISAAQAKTTPITNPKDTETPNLTPIDSIITSYLDQTNKSPERLNTDAVTEQAKAKATAKVAFAPEEKFVHEGTSSPQGKWASLLPESLNRSPSGRLWESSAENWMLPEKNFSMDLSRDITILQDIIVRQSNLELYQQNVNHMKGRLADVLFKLEVEKELLKSKVEHTELEGRSKKQSGPLSDFTHAEVLEALKEGDMRINELKENISILEKTSGLYGDLIEEHRIDISNHKAHLKRLQDISVKYNLNNGSKVSK